MRKTILFSLFAILTLASACSISNKVTKAEPYKTNVKESNDTKSNTNKNLVLVELFTSEGCSSCPPADRALAKLQKEQPVENAEIVTLAYHVDYWNYLGWKDKFSSAKYSQRQGDYVRAFNITSSYTPQMIIDGRREFVGSRYAQALTQIGEESKNKKGSTEIGLKKSASSADLKVNISDLDTKEDSEVYLAIAEDDLVTNVKRGENSGKKLTHVSVVREFTKIGDVVAGTKTFEVEKTINLDSKWKKDKLKFVVFAQNKKSKHIVALGKTSYQ